MDNTAAATPTTSRTIRVWDLPIRIFHWLLVATVLVAFLSAEEESALASWHVTAGWVAAILIVFRVVWGFVGGEHARFAQFLKPWQIGHHLTSLTSSVRHRSVGHNPLGGIAVIALLTVVASVIYSGVRTNGDAGEGLHEAFANALLALVAVHVFAVIAMSMLTRENLFTAFITGRKRADLHPDVADAHPPMPLAVPVAGIAVGLAAYSIMAADPAAYTPGVRAEAGEGFDRGDRD